MGKRLLAGKASLSRGIELTIVGQEKEELPLSQSETEATYDG